MVLLMLLALDGLLCAGAGGGRRRDQSGDEKELLHTHRRSPLP
jgi:hypothetical protein